MHQHLSKLEGSWQGVARLWFEPGNPTDESPVSGTIRLVFGGKYAIHEYKGTCMGKPVEGMAIFAYNLDLQRFEVAWIDSFHTGTFILFSEGQRNTKDLDARGSYAYITPETEQFWGWRTTIEMENENKLVITAYNISPEGQEQKATETVYERVK